MSFSLESYPTVIDFLRKHSPSFIEVNSREIQVCCPYCDDAMRPNASNHGHLYISTESPVFHCFRCEMSGLLPRLLADMGFDNKDIIDDISSSIGMKISTLTKTKLKQHSVNTIINEIKINNIKFISEYNQESILLHKYLHTRFGGYIDINKFLISYYKSKNILGLSFYNYNGANVTTRFINHPKIRYKRTKNIRSDLSREYYFQNPNFDIYKNIVIAEGPFDLINLYLYNTMFNNNETFYVSLLGKRYVSFIEMLVRTDLVLGKYNINIVFDKDDKYCSSYLYRSRKIVNEINPDITINGFIPSVTKDAGELPIINHL